ncbi:MAG: TldD/PmbA family protein [Deltaproteobacteria bacterium]|nr:TldD/PmbA family protein [Deltaproteobacteria bacterium]
MADPDPGALLPHCRRAVELARKAGADEAEAFAEETRTVSARAEQNDLAGAEHQESRALGLRVLCRGATGFYALNRLDEPALDEAARVAVALARAGRPEDGPVLADPEPPAPVAGLYDEEVASTEVPRAVEHCHALLAAARGTDARVSMDGVEVAFSVSRHAVANSRGVGDEEVQTSAAASLFGMAIDGEDVTSFDHEVDAHVRLAALTGVRAARELARRLISFLGAGAWDGPSRPRVVLAPEVLGELLVDPLVASLDGESVRAGRSGLRDRRGAVVSVPGFELVDDPTAPGEVGSEAFDREGRPHRTTPILLEGVLQTFLHTTDSARRLGDRPTGHASGGARSLPSADASRLLVGGGSASLGDLLAEAGEGLYVGRFSGSVDEVSGDFSGVAKCSFRIRGGKLAEPLRETTLAGNAYSALKAVRGLTRERKALPGRVYPHALVDGLDVSGAD